MLTSKNIFFLQTVLKKTVARQFSNLYLNPILNHVVHPVVNPVGNHVVNPVVTPVGNQFVNLVGNPTFCKSWGLTLLKTIL